MKKKKCGGCLPGLISALLLCAIICAGGSVVLRRLSYRGKTVTANTIVDRIRQTQQLVTLSYAYQDAGTLKDQKDFKGIPVPFTGRSVAYIFAGTINAGIDTSGVEVSVDHTAKTVTLSIPPAKIISHEIPPENVQCVAEQKGFFADFTMDDYSDLLAGRKAEIEAAFLDENRLADAQIEAGNVLRDLLNDVLQSDGYSLVIHYA